MTKSKFRPIKYARVRLTDTDTMVIEVKNEGHLPDGTPMIVGWRVRSDGSGYVTPNLVIANEIVERGIKLVGVDYLSVEQKGAKGHPVHNVLLKAGIISLEGCKLSDVPAGEYEIIALPLRIQGGDGSPARVILKKL